MLVSVRVRFPQHFMWGLCPTFFKILLYKSYKMSKNNLSCYLKIALVMLIPALIAFMVLSLDYNLIKSFIITLIVYFVSVISTIGIFKYLEGG